MAKLKTDSPLSRRIVHAFLNFLDSVDPAPGDIESLEVAKECLIEAFNIDPTSVARQSEPDLLVNMFSSEIELRQRDAKSDFGQTGCSSDAKNNSSLQNAGVASILGPSGAQEINRRGEDHFLGVSRDELFGQFFGALENIHYFKITPDGRDEQAQLDRATHIFHSALLEMQNSGCQIYDRKNLAETLKSQGNKAMQSERYSDAIELYSCAIALIEDNAVYYCNRAAAYTQTHQYLEAISDCQKSVEIDPNYGKAYSRLGFAYYAQGKYRDAIDKGFMKALQLDPNNDSIKENIQVAEQKLKEQQQGSGHNQSAGESMSRVVPPPFTSIPININGLPINLASMLTNIAGNAFQGQHDEGRSEEGDNAETRGTNTFNVNGLPANLAGMFMNMAGNTYQGQQTPGGAETGSSAEARTTNTNDANGHPPDFASMFRNIVGNASQGQETRGGAEAAGHAYTFGEPGMRVGGSIDLNFGEQMPEDLAGTLRSVMEMFSGAAPNVNQDDNINDRSAPR